MPAQTCAAARCHAGSHAASLHQSKAEVEQITAASANLPQVRTVALETTAAEPSPADFAQILSTAITRAVRNGSSDGAAKYWVPDSFNGTDPYKLRNFLTQCEIYFRANHLKFRTDNKKVMFAFSYLTNNALEWFEQKFLDAKEPSQQFPNSASQADKDFHSDKENDQYLTAL